MAENIPPASSVDLQNRLQEAAGLLRDSTSVQPEVRQVLVDLLEELKLTLASTQMPPEQLAHLAGTAAHLAEALHHEPHSWVERVRTPFEEAAVQAETHAPVAVGLVKRLLSLLSDMGI
ncbi:MAG: hypothetical protein U0840_14265 [Gemmataceae bacterium]